MDRKLTMEELGRVDAEAYRAMAKRPIRVVLDDVRSRHNVGAIFRTADAFALEGLVLCGFTPCPPHREIEKTALGATFSVPWEHRPTALEAVEGLKRSGYTVLSVEQTVHARPLGDWRPGVGEKLAVVFGNELNGVSKGVIAASDGCLVLPQEGTKHSLNVAVCAGIVLWQACRQGSG
jgi:23S rRNA (guanosine2251-2'-O)-methyltransferase